MRTYLFIAGLILACLILIIILIAVLVHAPQLLVQPVRIAQHHQLLQLTEFHRCLSENGNR
ncbi:hypothetical protein WP50_35065 [Lactiplantibacillus plantarum]|nr:hypothetical protein WP50_35065 [Lactiplantibacillus plantarum]